MFICQTAQKEFSHFVKNENFQNVHNLPSGQKQDPEKMFLEKKPKKPQIRESHFFSFLYFSLPSSGKDFWMLRSKSLPRFIFMKREIDPTMETKNNFRIPHRI